MTRTPSPATRFPAALCVALLTLLGAPAAAQHTTIEFFTHDELALHWWVRAEAERPADLQAPEARAAIAALRDYEQEGGNPMLVWARIEPLLLAGLPLEDAVLRSHARGMPERYYNDAGGLSPEEARTRLHDLKPDPRPYTDALDALRPWYLATIAPAAGREVEAAIESLNEYLAPRLADCYRDACDALGMTDPGHSVPVYLVPSGPRPGAITYRSRTGLACVVALDAGTDCQGAGLDLLVEVILHETLHALDFATQEQPTALQQLRAALRESSHVERLRDLPHTLIFLQAAAVVRDHFGPDHRGYGELCRYYQKVPAAIRALRQPWADRLDRHVPLPETVAAILANLDDAERAAAERNRPTATQPARPE